MPASRQFAALGSEVEIQIETMDPGTDRNALLEYAEQRLRDLERRWSRFVETSEVCQLNRAGGRPTIVSPETARLVATALEAYDRTDGIFDPRVLDALERAGYSTSHELLDPDSAAPATETGNPGPAQADRPRLEATVDETLGAVTLPAGERWDPGGIGKGLACDLLVEELAELGASSIMVNLGGDLRVFGDAFGEPCWTIQVADPLNADLRLADIHLMEGSVATSSRVKRRWLHQGESRHHVIDPRTARPAVTDLLSVTVVAASTWWAEVLAKTALILGVDAGRELIAAAGCSALLARDDGEISTLGGHVRIGTHA